MDVYYTEAFLDLYYTDFIGLFDDKPLPSRSDAPETDAQARDAEPVGAAPAAPAVSEAPLGVKPTDYIDGTG